MITGKTNKAISGEIGICEKTVEFHLHHIYTKIGIRTRLMAGLWAIQQERYSLGKSLARRNDKFPE